MPPFPACGTVRGPAEKNSREDPDRGQGRRQNLLQLDIKTEQVQRNKTLICTAAAPGLHPLRVGPIKSWAEQEHGRPQGQCTELRKVSLQDTREKGRAKALLFSDTSSTGRTFPGP